MLKKIYLTFGVVLILTSCATQQGTQTTFDLDAIQTEKTIQLKAGEQIKLEVTTNPTPGYDWQTTTSKDCVVTLLNKENIPNLSEEMFGASIRNSYTIKAEQAGKCSIQFEYKRSWETEPANNTKRIHFIVK